MRWKLNKNHFKYVKCYRCILSMCKMVAKMHSKCTFQHKGIKQEIRFSIIKTKCFFFSITIRKIKENCFRAHDRDNLVQFQQLDVNFKKLSHCIDQDISRDWKNGLAFWELKLCAKLMKFDSLVSWNTRDTLCYSQAN